MMLAWRDVTRGGVRFGAVGLVLGVAFMGVVACGHDAGPPAPSPAGSSTPSASASSTLTGAEQEAASKAVAAYNGYFASYVRAAAVPDPDDPALSDYVGGALLSLSRHNIRMLKDHGVVELGHPNAAVIGTRVDLAAAPPAVTIDACVDYTDFRLVDKVSQSPVPNTSLERARYTTTATVELFADGRWLVADDSPHRDTPC